MSVAAAAARDGSPRDRGDGAALSLSAAQLLAAALELVYWPALQMFIWGFTASS